jgi:FkbM family methyltransferase
MLIPLSKICSKYEIIPIGILHVGACQMEELQDYLDLSIKNVIWVEGNSRLVVENKQKAHDSGHILLEGLIYDEDDLEVNFNLTNNLQSSSILSFEKHSEYHPHVYVENTIKAKTITLKNLLKSNNINFDFFDFVNLDIQGVELRALKGMGDYLNNVNYVYTEVNTGNVYSGNDTINEIDDYLGSMGFIRVETEITPYEWGDAFYMKK